MSKSEKLKPGEVELSSAELASRADQRTNQLIQAIREGNELAFVEMMRLYRTEVYRIAYGMLGSDTEATKIATRVFVRLYKSLRQLSGDQKIRKWLLRMTINSCYDTLGITKKASDFVAQYLPGCMAAMQGGGTKFEAEQVNEMVLESLSLLTARERAALVLTAQLGYSSADAAEAMGVDIGTVRMLNIRSRNKLKAALLPGTDFGGASANGW